jgi:hypothetical protein
MKKREISYDGQTLWDHRAAGAPRLYSRKPDWIMAPPEIIQRAGGPKKRRVLRQFTAKCPLSGKPVRTLEVQGGLYCFESPGHGWLWSNTLELENPEVIRGTDE